MTAEQTAGGLAGSAHWLPGPLISDCYVQGSVAGSVVGGLAGEARHNQFLNCYAACELFPLKTGDDEPLVGGLFGDVWVTDWGPKAVSCFWDAELSQVNFGAGSRLVDLGIEIGMGLTTQQMQNPEVFQDAGWDFDTVWMICDGDYPRLQWEAEECDKPQL
ncbi:MAG: hypothetical protein A2Z25_01400 [Planctomycetes bacterium RBG_16_55_9]|nr:MAG: hypothetical protein A2Z25_01400 [Planctomycetes bacterium RBG_16_55_9]